MTPVELWYRCFKFVRRHNSCIPTRIYLWIVDVWASGHELLSRVEGRDG